MTSIVDRTDIPTKPVQGKHWHCAPLSLSKCTLEVMNLPSGSCELYYLRSEITLVLSEVGCIRPFDHSAAAVRVGSVVDSNEGQVSGCLLSR